MPSGGIALTKGSSKNVNKKLKGRKKDWPCGAELQKTGRNRKWEDGAVEILPCGGITLTQGSRKNANKHEGGGGNRVRRKYGKLKEIENRRMAWWKFCHVVELLSRKGAAKT